MKTKRSSCVVVDFVNDLCPISLSGLAECDSSYVDILDFTKREYLPLYSPTYCNDPDDIERKAEVLTNHIKHLYTANEWSSGIEQMINAAMTLCLADENLTMLNFRDILDTTPRSKELRAQILRQTFQDDQELRKYWEYDFENTDPRTKKIAIRKISAFLKPKRIQQLFSIKKHAFNAEDIINNGRFCFANFNESILGPQTSRYLGGCFLEDLFAACKARRGKFTEEEMQLMPCTIYIDEFFKAPVKAFEEATVTLRKYNVSLVLSYHFQEQLNKTLQMGLKNFSTHIVFKQSYEEAVRASAQFLKKVEPNEFMHLKQREGYVINPDSEIRKFRTIFQKLNDNSEALNTIWARNLKEKYIKVSDIEMMKKRELEIINRIPRSGDDI